jgi:quinol monooxygenase YgiN
MFMRLVQMKVSPDRIREFVAVYERTIIPALRQTPGCLYAGLVQSLEEENDGISITLWDAQDAAFAYERSGKFAELLDASRPFFSDSVEWRVQLSDDLKLELGPVVPELVVKSYAADLPPDRSTEIPGGERNSLYLRIVSMKINPERKGEFVEIYHHEIIPALRQVEGCLDAYLAEGVRGDNELLSITIWSGLEQAKSYEATGKFDELKEKVRHTFASLARWKMALDDVPLPGVRRVARRAVTSEDVAVRTFSIVVSQAFR